MKLVLIRHGETLWNAEKRLQGHADAPLSSAGEAQIRSLAPLVATLPARLHAVSSDLGRARQSAALLGFPHAASDPRLREMDLGVWTGLTRAEIEAREPGAYAAWRRGEATPEGGENWAAFRTRICEAMEEFAGSGHDCVLAVTHEGAVRAACEALCGLAPNNISPAQPGTATIFDIAGPAPRAARILAFNLGAMERSLAAQPLDHVAV